MFSNSDCGIHFTFDQSVSPDLFALDNHFLSFHLVSDDPSDLPLPPATLSEAEDSIRKTSISHSGSTHKLLHKGEIMYLHLQQILPSIYLIRDLQPVLFFNYFAVHMAAFQKDLVLARIQPGSPLSDFWLLRARGYTATDLESLSPSTKAAAVSGNPFMSPRFPTDSQDVLFYLLWTRRQFHVYLMRVHTWGCKHTRLRHFFAPIQSSWVEPLTPDEVSELRRRVVAGPLAYADHWSAYATTTPDFPPLPPFDLDQEISSYSIDSYASSCTPLLESPLFTDSSIPIGLFEEIFLRFFPFILL